MLTLYTFVSELTLSGDTRGSQGQDMWEMRTWEQVPVIPMPCSKDQWFLAPHPYSRVPHTYDKHDSIFREWERVSN